MLLAHVSLIILRLHPPLFHFIHLRLPHLRLQYHRHFLLQVPSVLALHFLLLLDFAFQFSYFQHLHFLLHPPLLSLHLLFLHLLFLPGFQLLKNCLFLYVFRLFKALLLIQSLRFL